MKRKFTSDGFFSPNKRQLQEHDRNVASTAAPCGNGEQEFYLENDPKPIYIYGPKFDIDLNLRNRVTYSEFIFRLAREKATFDHKSLKYLPQAIMKCSQDMEGSAQALQLAQALREIFARLDMFTNPKSKKPDENQKVSHVEFLPAAKELFNFMSSDAYLQCILRIGAKENKDEEDLEKSLRKKDEEMAMSSNGGDVGAANATGVKSLLSKSPTSLDNIIEGYFFGSAVILSAKTPSEVANDLLAIKNAHAADLDHFVHRLFRKGFEMLVQQKFENDPHNKLAVISFVFLRLPQGIKRLLDIEKDPWDAAVREALRRLSNSGDILLKVDELLENNSFQFFIDCLKSHALVIEGDDDNIRALRKTHVTCAKASITMYLKSLLILVDYANLEERLKREEMLENSTQKKNYIDLNDRRHQAASNLNNILHEWASNGRFASILTRAYYSRHVDFLTRLLLTINRITGKKRINIDERIHKKIFETSFALLLEVSYRYDVRHVLKNKASCFSFWFKRILWPQQILDHETGNLQAQNDPDLFQPKIKRKNPADPGELYVPDQILDLNLSNITYAEVYKHSRTSLILIIKRCRSNQIPEFVSQWVQAITREMPCLGICLATWLIRFIADNEEKREVATQLRKLIADAITGVDEAGCDPHQGLRMNDEEYVAANRQYEEMFDDEAVLNLRGEKTFQSYVAELFSYYPPPTDTPQRMASTPVCFPEAEFRDWKKMQEFKNFNEGIREILQKNTQKAWDSFVSFYFYGMLVPAQGHPPVSMNTDKKGEYICGLFLIDIKKCVRSLQILVEQLPALRMTDLTTQNNQNNFIEYGFPQVVKLISSCFILWEKRCTLKKELYNQLYDKLYDPPRERFRTSLQKMRQCLIPFKSMADATGAEGSILSSGFAEVLCNLAGRGKFFSKKFPWEEILIPLIDKNPFNFRIEDIKKFLSSTTKHNDVFALAIFRLKHKRCQLYHKSCTHCK